MQTSRSRILSSLLSVGVLASIIILGTFTTTNAQQDKGAPKGGKGGGKGAPPAAAKQEAKGAEVSFPGYIGGVVTSEKGPEAGVWVIAETKDTQTPLIKIVVTDDQGRYLLPDLPVANYDVWVRGYGLADSAKTKSRPVTTPLNLRAATAKTPQEAAKVYPGNYWLSMVEPPAPNMFPGTGAEGNKMPTAMGTQNHWLNSFKSQCNFCHQLGNGITRDLDPVFKGKEGLKTHEDAWDWRLGVGTRGSNMYGVLNTEGKEPTLKALSDWTRSIAAGAVPPVPPRPTGVERNIVTTLWDIGDDHSFVHDQVATSKYSPTVHGGGRIYAVSAGHGQLLWVDPRENASGAIDIPTRMPKTAIGSRFPKPTRPSLYWGDEWLWAGDNYDPADPHNAMVANDGKVWMTTKLRTGADAARCSDGKNPFSAWYPHTNSGRQAGYYEPETGQFTLIDTCFSTHHLQFDNDANETVYFNELSGPIVGWIDTKVYAETKDETKAVGWCGQVIDSNGDGKITQPWNQVAAVRGGEESILYATDTAGGGNAKGKGKQAPFDPKLDSQVRFSLYSVIPSPVDDVVWGVSESPYPGMLVRMKRGANPPESCTTQVFMVPTGGFDPRGVDIDSNGVVWTALAGSSHLASFDFRKCKDLTGPQKVDGSQCREGWSLHQTTGPKLKGTNVPADFHYYNWVDQKNIIGLGANTPIATGSNSDSLLALNPQTNQWTTFRVPYPLGFYARGLDGRIDNADAGWKGRALYSNYGTHLVWHIEGGKGTKGKIVKFQIRPNPLAN